MSRLGGIIAFVFEKPFYQVKDWGGWLRVILVLSLNFKPSSPIWSVFSGLWSGSGLFSRNWSRNGLDLHKKVRIWPKMDEFMLKIGLFLSWIEWWSRCVLKLKTSKIYKKSLISWYWSGFKANSSLDLVRIGTKKWSVFGPILINLGPIWQVVALRGRGGLNFSHFSQSQLFCNYFAILPL